ncbi:hypothetical protein [Marinicella meishanensis]|uniref:hypothetical protein n=1 Tax=Marinicella meishanensis TaxID=2873263 RepID=UPI001CC06D2B|nr:hypothetical protein [Marinicella sp. NBU2979]
MKKLIWILTLILYAETDALAVLRTQVKFPENMHQKSIDLAQLVETFSPYLRNLPNNFHHDCSNIDQGLVFRYGASTVYSRTLFWWDLYEHPLEGKRCIKYHSKGSKFLTPVEAQVLYHVSRYNSWHELPWMAQIKLRFDLFQNYFCNMARFHRASEVKEHVIEFNLCFQERTVRGMMFGSKAVIEL